MSRVPSSLTGTARTQRGTNARTGQVMSHIGHSGAGFSDFSESRDRDDPPLDLVSEGTSVENTVALGVRVYKLIVQQLGLETCGLFGAGAGRGTGVCWPLFWATAAILRAEGAEIGEGRAERKAQGWPDGRVSKCQTLFVAKLEYWQPGHSQSPGREDAGFSNSRDRDAPSLILVSKGISVENTVTMGRGEGRERETSMSVRRFGFVGLARPLGSARGPASAGLFSGQRRQF